ncbi:MAG: 3'-5' exonuclease, partial [Planctomycetota bacterium]
HLRELAGRRRISLLEACEIAGETSLREAHARKVQAFAKMIAQLASDLDRPVREIMEDVVRVSGLNEVLRKAEDNAWENVGELISTAAEFDEANEDATLADYLHQVSLVSDVDRMDGTAGAVTLMTLHAAKGLEFPVVFIIGCEEGLLPFDRSEIGDVRWMSDDDAQLEEERRLAFVGMTRTQTELTLSCVRSRMIRGRHKPQAASMFLEEIGDTGVQREDLTSGEPSRPSSGKSGHRGGFYDDVEERRIIESSVDANPFPPEYEYLKVGSMVRHPQFGKGKVVKLAQQWPETRATIHFESWGSKKIVLAMTNLELVWKD